MIDLDETGLKAARDACEGLLISHDLSDGDLAAVITAYLEATRTSDALRDLQRLGQECEQTRLAVIANSEGAAIGLSLKAGVVSVSEDGWQSLKSLSGAHVGPWRRQIVRCHLLRPEPVGEIVGSVEG